MHSLTCMLVVVCVVRKPRPCNSYSRRRDRINSVLWRSYYKGGGGSAFAFVVAGGRWTNAQRAYALCAAKCRITLWCWVVGSRTRMNHQMSVVAPKWPLHVVSGVRGGVGAGSGALSPTTGAVCGSALNRCPMTTSHQRHNAWSCCAPPVGNTDPPPPPRGPCVGMGWGAPSELHPPLPSPRLSPPRPCVGMGWGAPSEFHGLECGALPAPAWGGGAKGQQQHM